MTPEMKALIEHCIHAWEKDHVDSFYTACKESDISIDTGPNPYDYLHRHEVVCDIAEQAAQSVLPELFMLCPMSLDMLNSELDRLIVNAFRLNLHVAALVTDAFVRIRQRSKAGQFYEG